MDQLKFQLGQLVTLARTSEEGEIIGRAEYAASEPSYFIRYAAADGRQTELWWTESAIASS